MHKTSVTWNERVDAIVAKRLSWKYMFKQYIGYTIQRVVVFFLSFHPRTRMVKDSLYMKKVESYIKLQRAYDLLVAQNIEREMIGREESMRIARLMD